MQSIADFCPRGAEAGTGLVLLDNGGRYLFFVAGKALSCPPGERFYAGIGGHREAGEDWAACAHREALEEIGTDVDLQSAPVTWYIPQQGPIRHVQLADRPRPFALYEMIHPAGTPRAGEVYRIVVYEARLHSLPKNLAGDEVLAVIALTPRQVMLGVERKPTLGELMDEGAGIVVASGALDRNTRLYPLGTAEALAFILRHIQGQEHHGPMLWKDQGL